MSILISVLIVVVLISLILVFSGGKKVKNKKEGASSAKGNANLIRDYTKKLSHNPNDVNVLQGLADIYFNNKDYEKAMPLYENLYKLMTAHVELNQQKIAIRYAISAFKQEKFDEALVGCTKVLRIDPRDYDANLYIGKIMLEKNEHEKAILYLKRAVALNPESTEIFEPLGKVLFESKKYRDSLPYIKKVLDENPENKEMLFKYAFAMKEINMGEKALKIFMHLRTDAKYGPDSCVECGILHDRMGQHEKSIQDYEIALKFENISTELKINIYYKMAHTYLAERNVSMALMYLKKIQGINQNYKDVNQLVNRYQELSGNNNLQVYLMSSTSDFIVLCRKFVASYYSNSFVKVEDVNVTPEFVEILCTVESSKWSDTEIFRFFRSTGAIGELYIRDCHSKIRDTKCDKALCVTAGNFTEEAIRYVDGRPIDLIEKSKLVQVLKKIDLGK